MKSMWLPRFLIAVFLMFAAALTVSQAYAVNPDEVLDDPALEARAREISTGLRCLVCQNQSIDDSDAPLAKDLRILVRERLVAGDTDAEAKSFLVSRYGEFVLLKPTFSSKNLILWSFGPLVLILGIFGIFRLYRKNKQVADKAKEAGSETLSDEERSRLKKILSDESNA
nr:cytochrome c-type biogenesis protein [Cohaesibacter celericrescens]